MKQQVIAVHYTANYILNPQHPITINLVGCGGTGSQVLTGLARLNAALKALEHPGIHVTAWDPDIVTEANIGRQAFAPADLHANKAATLITRVNRFYGFDWKARSEFYAPVNMGKSLLDDGCNILITCVDSAAARVAISKGKFGTLKGQRPYTRHHYWMDFGNTRTTGQVVLGTFDHVEQNGAAGEVTCAKLQTVTEMFPDIEKHDTTAEQGPSCSFAEAIQRQDLYINSTLTQLGMTLLWKLFREGKISYQGAWLNLDLLMSNPMPIFVTRIIRTPAQHSRTVKNKKHDRKKTTRRVPRRHSRS